MHSDFRSRPERRRVQTVEHQGRETAYGAVNVSRNDDSPTPLYVHGSGGTHQVWAAQYSVGGPTASAAALDLSGHGDSADIETDPGPETLAAYVEDVVAVGREADADILVGNSLGGAVALQAALADAMELEALVLIGTGAKLAVGESLRDLLATDFERAIDALHRPDMLFHDPGDQTVERSRATMRAVGQAVTRRDFLTCHAFDVRDRLGSLELPALAVVGEHDSLTPPKYHEYLADRIPDCDSLVVPDAAHLAMVERPAAVNDTITDFLGEQGLSNSAAD